jgi:hypothetical protein
VITVALLLGTGLVANLAGRAGRRQTVEVETQAGIIRLLNTITRAVAISESIDRLAAEGIYKLLDARRVMIGRGDPDREVVVVVVDIGEPEAPLDVDHLTQLDAEGHIFDGRLRQPGVGGAVGATLPRGHPPARPASAARRPSHRGLP